MFALATIIEILATFIPFIDNALDIISTPISMIAGTVLASSSLSNLDPGLQWILSIICGIGVTGSFQFATVTLRGMLSVFTGGILNPFFSLLEDTIAFLIAISTILIPIFGLLIIIIALIIYLLIKKLRYRKRKKKLIN